MNGITYGVPAGLAATNNVTFTYDEAGNRASMSNGAQLALYHYNLGSQLDWEQVNFPNLGPTWYRMDYQYNLAGEVTRVTNPWNAQVAYSYDAVGRVMGVAGTDVNGQPTYAGVSSYAQSISYRAFGGLNGLIYGNRHPEQGATRERALGLGYDNRQRLTEWHAGYVMGWSYSYNNFDENTGRVTFARSSMDATLNRSYDYD